MNQQKSTLVFAGLFAISALTLAAVVVTVFLEISSQQEASSNQNRLLASVRVLYPEQKPIAQHAMEIIAKNKRIASIVSYTASSAQPLANHYEFVSKLEKELRNDIITDMAFENLKEAGSTITQMTQIDETTFMFRDRWPLVIKPGSHFYDHPVKKVLFINESFTAPVCARGKGYEPYVIYQSTNPDYQVNVLTDTQGQTLQYRVTAKDKNGTPVLFDVNDRILVDAGCIVAPEVNQ